MAAVDDLDQLIEQYNLALGEFYKGNPEPVQKLYSHRNEVTLAPPFGPPTHGWDEVAASMERDRKSTRLNSSHTVISYAVFCLKKKKSTSPQRREKPGRKTFDHNRQPSFPALRFPFASLRLDVGRLTAVPTVLLLPFFF